MIIWLQDNLPHLNYDIHHCLFSAILIILFIDFIIPPVIYTSKQTLWIILIYTLFDTRSNDHHDNYNI